MFRDSRPQEQTIANAPCAILVTISMAKESIKACQDWPPFIEERRNSGYQSN